MGETPPMAEVMLRGGRQDGYRFKIMCDSAGLPATPVVATDLTPDQFYALAITDPERAVMRPIFYDRQEFDLLDRVWVFTFRKPADEGTVYDDPTPGRR